MRNRNIPIEEKNAKMSTPRQNPMMKIFIMRGKGSFHCIRIQNETSFLRGFMIKRRCSPSPHRGREAYPDFGLSKDIH